MLPKLGIKALFRQFYSTTTCNPSHTRQNLEGKRWLHSAYRHSLDISIEDQRSWENHSPCLWYWSRHQSFHGPSQMRQAPQGMWLGIGTIKYTESFIASDARVELLLVISYQGGAIKLSFYATFLEFWGHIFSWPPRFLLKNFSAALWLCVLVE